MIRSSIGQALDENMRPIAHAFTGKPDDASASERSSYGLFAVCVLGSRFCGGGVRSRPGLLKGPRPVSSAIVQTSGCLSFESRHFCRIAATTKPILDRQGASAMGLYGLHPRNTTGTRLTLRDRPDLSVRDRGKRGRVVIATPRRLNRCLLVRRGLL